MAFDILTIPFDPKQGVFSSDLLRDVLMNRKLQSYRAEFFLADGKPYWTIFIEYDPLLKDSPGRTLSEAQQHLFTKLAEWRKARAETEGLPHFIIATNKDLESIAYTAPRTKAALQQIKGFGKKKIEKYSDDILHIISAFYTADKDR